MARAEKQREKFAKRLERKKGELGTQPESPVEETTEEAPSTEALA